MAKNSTDNRKLSTEITTKKLFLSLPPLRHIRGKLRQFLLKNNLLALHFLLLLAFYSVTMVAALREGAVIIADGIGIFQNPPFFIHLVGGVTSLPLVYIVIHRVLSLQTGNGDSSVIDSFTRRIQRSRTAVALFSVATFLGMVVLAYNLTLGFSYQIPIYDSPRFPVTFGAYQVIRAYLYLFCYPLVFSAPPVITYYLFQSVDREGIRYKPFHIDGLGGFRKYFVAVDRPIYAVQSVAVLIALMNYIGWGRMEFAPLVLAISAPILVTMLGIHLFFHFHRVVASKRRAEIQKIRLQQMKIYASVAEFSELSSKDCLDLLDELEATGRLADMIEKSPKRGLQKYFLNLVLLAAPYVLRPLGQLVVTRLIDGTWWP